MAKKCSPVRKKRSNPQEKAPGGRGLGELLRVYQDVERTLKSLRASAGPLDPSQYPINLKKLITQLSRSKRQIERKIGDTLFQEKQNLKRRFKAFTSNLSSKH